MMKENMEKLEEETNQYVEMRREKKKKRKKKNEQKAKESLENLFVHETGSSNREQNKKNKESKLEKEKGGFIESGESNNSETLEKESIMQFRNQKKKKRKQKESKLNEVEESRKFKTLEKESRIKTSNGKKNKKKEKESELEEVHKKLVEYEDSINTETLEKESTVELNNDKKKKKKNKREKNVSDDTNKEITNNEDCKGNNKCNGISNLEDDTLIEPENNDKIDKKRNKQDVKSTESEVCKSGVIFDTSDNEKNNKNKKKNMKNNKESTIDDELKSLSKQSIASEVVDKKGKKKGKKKLDDNVSHLDKQIESPVKRTWKGKLPCLEEHGNPSPKKKRKMNGETESVKSSSPRAKKRKIGDASEGESGKKKKSNKENNDTAENDEFYAKNKKLGDEVPHPKPRTVRFSSNVQVFPMNEDDLAEKVYNEKNGDDPCNTIYNENNNFAGRRFSPYEDQLIRDAVQKYIATNQLGEDAIGKIIYSSKSGLKGCWKEISKDLPWRHFSQVYARGRLILQMSELGENRGFSEEEIKTIMDFHAQNGPKWNELAKDLRKNRIHIKDAFRRRRLRKTLNKGKWSQDEYQKLYDLVHQNLCMKIHEKKKSTNPMTRDDISWEAISEKMKTRLMITCCQKWYDSLASPLVREGKWSDSDDYRLLDALYYQEACCEEDVDWDDLVDTRPGEYCQKRWKEMVRHIGEYKERSFRDQINLLKGRYNANMLKYVEALKNRNREEASDDEEEIENGDERDADKDKERK